MGRTGAGRAMALKRHLVVFAHERAAASGGWQGGSAPWPPSDSRWTAWVAVTPDGGRLPRLPAGPRLRPQGAGDLGERMRRPMRRPPVGLPPGPVVVIGSDIPGIRRHHIAEAFRVLGSHSFVFGPARDGGYWLVGARRRPAEAPDIFGGGEMVHRACPGRYTGPPAPWSGGAGTGGAG